MRKLFLASAATIALLSFSSCEKEIVYSGDVNIKFNKIVGTNSEQLQLNNNRVYNHPSNYKYSFSEFKYFISQIELFHGSGDTIKLLQRPYLVDANRIETLNLNNITNIKSGLIKGIRIIYGLQNSEIPSGEKQAYIEEMLSEGKYLYFKASGKFNVDETNSGGNDFKLIMGKTASKNNAVIKDYIQNFIFNEKLKLEFNIDVNQIFSNPNEINLKNFDRGLVDSEDAQNKIAENLFNAISIKVLE